VTRIKSATVSKERPAGSASVPLLDSLDPTQFAAAWKGRAEACEKVMQKQMVTTPTSASLDSNVASSVPNFGQGWNRAPTLLGTLLHKFLEQWDFTCEKCSMPAMLTRIANSYFAQEGLLRRPLPDPKEGKLKLEENDPMADIVAMVDEAQKILADFIGSEAWEEIKDSKILGREVPFFYGNAPMMRGTIDILYRLLSGQIVIGDYKSGHTKQNHAAQGAAYQEAVRRALGVEAVFKVIHLREETNTSL
jgi:ATP-dependent helicase/nuclease subunit A